MSSPSSTEAPLLTELAAFLEDVSLVAFSGKKKSSKKKGSSAAAKASDENVDVVEPEAPSVGSTDAGNSNVNKSEEVAGNSKNKKKNKKKSGRTAQEEEDLDKLLAELGETPPVPKPTTLPQDDKVQPLVFELVPLASP